MNGTSESHARHDLHLVAALAADDLAPVVRTEAETLVASCRDCAELVADLRAIAAATAALPDIPRTRDFRLTAADAARLQPRGWRGLLDAIGGARASFSRPLATGLTTLGLVGLLVTTIPGALSGLSFGNSGAAPAALAPEAGGGNRLSGAPSTAAGVFGAAGDSAATAGPAAYASIGPNQAAPSAAASVDGQVDTSVPAPQASRESIQSVGTAAPVAGGVANPPPGTKSRGTGAGASAGAGTTDDLGGRDSLASTPGQAGSWPWLAISIVLLVAGLGLFAARWGARRLARH
jgi:hypothetical protein